jgi:hypothetical protein
MALMIDSDISDSYNQRETAERGEFVRARMLLFGARPTSLNGELVRFKHQ